MKSLRSIFRNPPRGTAWKWPHYFPVYERHFAVLRSTPIKMLEIGVCQGGSLWMWKSYFENSEIVGLDIDPSARGYEGEGVTVCIGDQADEGFLRHVGRQHGPFDIVVDDGGHRWHQQIISLRTLFGYVNDGGLYLIEDLQNSYTNNLSKWLRRHARSFPFPPTISFLKRIVDAIHFRHNFRHKVKKDSLFSGHVASISFYEGIAVIEKGVVDVQPPIRSEPGSEPSDFAETHPTRASGRTAERERRPEN